MKELAVIVIIAHKSVLSKNEERSLLQCSKIFSNYPIKFICPKVLDVTVYKRLLPHADIDFIDKKWQSSYWMFSMLKVNKLLYKKYRKYEYILFYEADAWVFRDELKYWCERNFDYIGAPWFEGHAAGNSTKIIGAGNGGFSLRKNKSCLRVIRKLAFIKMARMFWFKSYLQAIVPFKKVLRLCNHILKIKDPEKLIAFILHEEILEDRYWSEGMGGVFTDFKVADIQSSLSFSFEVRPSLLFEMNGRNLPFGCHAWEKYEPQFWSAFIPETKEITIQDA
jgi:hypothetical protein